MENRKTQEESRMEQLKKEVRDNRVWLIFTGVVTLIGVGTGIYCRRQMKKTFKLVSKAAESVADMTVVDIRNDIVDMAVNNAANREVGRVVNRAVRLVEDDMTRQAQKYVRDAVKESYGKLSKTVSDAIAKEAAKIDGSQIMEEATEKAKEMLLQRFDGKLDGLMSDYQRNLDNVGKIYQSIASSMADKAGKDVTFKLG